MRTSSHHLHLPPMPHHTAGWWLGHTALGIAVAVLLVYGAGVLLAVALRLLA
jgi:hypothetical protein